MVSSSFTAAALMVLSAGAAPTTPNWQNDYGAAMAAAVAQQKPMAVFIGQGEAGYTKLVAGGQIPAEVGQMLSNRYVSVYVNTETAAGKALAGEFEMQAGLVISSRGGATQALRLPGTVNGTDLTGVLTTLSTTAPVAAATTTVAPAASYAAPVAYPATYAAPVHNYAPMYAPRMYTTGGCANGRCGR